MSRNPLFGSRGATLSVVAVPMVIAIACGDRGNDDLFDCEAACQDAQRGGRSSGGSTGNESGGSGPSLTGGSVGTGGSGAVAGASGSSGGSMPSTGGAASASGGRSASGGKASTGGTGAGGQGSGGVAGANAGSSGGGVSAAGSEQGGTTSSEGGTSSDAGSAGDSPGAGGAGEGPRTIQIGGLLDAWVDSCEEERNAGSDPTLSVDSDPCVYEIYLRPESLGDLPEGATIESALLELQCTDAGNTVVVRTITEDWSEESVTWETRPSLGDEIGSFLPDVGPIVIDIGSLVEEWLAGSPLHGVALVLATNTDGSDYHSAEGDEASAPRILVTYTP